ncbi:MAG: Ni/Fe hydrogenase subunit alpha [Gemmatimonadota bacterium]|nr:Ni/Fe hydrogenase subunit alpha [Gemmatimonadota bacterium]
MNTTRRVVIEPLTRVEGHGKVTIRLDEAGAVESARLHIVEFRGFERFIQGRPYWEIPVVVQRLCGICPVSHHLAAAKAMDGVVGADELTPTAEKVRRLMHYGQIFQSHALHFFHLASPDLLFGFDSEPAKRNVLGVAGAYPELARQGILMRKYGQEIIRATAGKKIHGTGAIPGGVNRSLSAADRAALAEELPRQKDWARDAVRIARDYTLEHADFAAEFAAFPSNHLALVRRGDGALDLYDGVLRAVDPAGERVLDDVEVSRYLDVLVEEVRPWSYMKFPFLRSLGPENGWYRVGPLARLAVCDHIDTPEAEEARREFATAMGGRPGTMSLAYHWARMVETLHAVEVIERLLDDPDIEGDDLVTKGERRSEVYGVIEAPRGTLFHHYVVGDDDTVVMANLIVSTTSNNEPMNRAVESVARRFLSGTEITEGLLNHVEVAIRAYDPCLSCATHALGRMPLVVEVHDAAGALVAEARRGA